MIKQCIPKNITIKIVVMVLAALFIGACKKNETTSKMASSFQPLEGAKLNSLKTSYGQDQNIILHNDNWLNTLSPDWKRVNEQKLDKGSVYEIMLNNPQGIFATDGKVDLKDAKQKYANKSSIRLLIFQDEHGQNNRACFMEVIATGESELPAQLRYKNYGNLNGLVSFYELDGKLANGWVYSNGKAVMSTTVNVLQTKSLSNTAKSGGSGRIMSGDGPPEGYIDCGTRLVAHTRTVCTGVGGLEGPGYEGGGEDSGKICNDQLYFVSERIYCPIKGGDGDYDPKPNPTPPPNGGESTACKDLKNSLNNILRSGDSFETCLDVPTGALAYNSAGEFKTAMDAETQNYETIKDEDDEKIVLFRTFTILLAGEDIYVKLNKNNEGKWVVTNVTSIDARNTLSISWTQITYTVNTSYNIIKVDLYGKRNWNIYLESFGTFYKQAVHYRMNIDNVTGKAVSIAKL